LSSLENIIFLIYVWFSVTHLNRQFYISRTKASGINAVVQLIHMLMLVMCYVLTYIGLSGKPFSENKNFDADSEACQSRQ